MNCPKCKIGLRSETIAGLQTDFCSRCAGVWLDSCELSKILGVNSDLPEQIIKSELKSQSNTYLIIDVMTKMRERLSPFEILNRCLSENGKRRYLLQGIDFTIEPKSEVTKMAVHEEKEMAVPEKKKRNIIKTQ